MSTSKLDINYDIIRLDHNKKLVLCEVLVKLYQFTSSRSTTSRPRPGGTVLTSIV